MVVASLEMLSGRSKKYAKEAEAVAAPDETASAQAPIAAANGAPSEPLEAVVAM